jgi:hypothetical protein
MRRGAFTQPRFIICEGFEDAALARGLIGTPSRHLQAFDVSPIPDVADAAGKDGFEDAFIGCDALTDFDNVSEVVIVADNDGNAFASFAAVRAQLLKAIRHNWAIPDHAGQKAVGQPSVSIWMWPSPGNNGCLETVLWDLIKTKYLNEANCVDAAMKCSGADAWPISKLDKARVRCFISIACKRNPAITLGLVWRDLPKLFPLTNPSFNPFARFLAAI